LTGRWPEGVGLTPPAAVRAAVAAGAGVEINESGFYGGSEISCHNADDHF